MNEHMYARACVSDKCNRHGGKVVIVYADTAYFVKSYTCM